MNEADSHPAPAPCATAPHGKSDGEKLFDRGVYIGLAGVGTFLATVPVAFLLKHHASVVPYFNKAVDWLHHQINRTPLKISRTTADKVLTTTALMQGGNVMLLPIGVAEHYKVPIVEGLNTALGDKTPPETIESAPKQTWGSLIESRALGWLAVFSVFAGVGKLYGKTLDSFEKETGNLLCKIMSKPTERMGETVVGGVRRWEMQPTKTFIFGKLGALDVFATIGSASLLYVGGHFFARKQQEHQAHRHVQQPARTAKASLGAAEEAVPAALPIAEPALQVRGEKTHEGTLQASAVAQQVG